MEPASNIIGIGATRDLALRVSVGALVRVLFTNPETGRRMLALERTATLREIEGSPKILVKAKPFGGGVRITDPNMLKKLIGDFHYDSERSFQEGDFRIMIDPASWGKVKEICREHLTKTKDLLMETSPERELAEEFYDSLKISFTPENYKLKRNGLIIEDLPDVTDNIYAQGLPTVRIYYLYEALITDSEIISMMLSNSSGIMDEDLKISAENDAKQGGKGRANAVLALDLDEILNIYKSIPEERRSEAVLVGQHQLDGNVPAILEEIDHPKYSRYFI